MRRRREEEGEEEGEEFIWKVKRERQFPTRWDQCAVALHQPTRHAPKRARARARASKRKIERAKVTGKERERVRARETEKERERERERKRAREESLATTNPCASGAGNRLSRAYPSTALTVADEAASSVTTSPCLRRFVVESYEPLTELMAISCCWV